jgi:hypothetical protein
MPLCRFVTMALVVRYEIIMLDTDQDREINYSKIAEPSCDKGDRLYWHKAQYYTGGGGQRSGPVLTQRPSSLLHLTMTEESVSETTYTSNTLTLN